jgi:hypothetical protein
MAIYREGQILLKVSITNQEGAELRDRFYLGIVA